MALVPKSKLQSPGWRFVFSCLIIGHLWAIVARPLDFATQGPNGSSPASGAFYAPIRSYAEFAYMNHGYAFFAPDPGPSHLLRVTVRNGNGDSKTMLYPDREEQWPRLLYHRHFMLTEFLHTLYQAPLQFSELPDEVRGDVAMIEDWKMRRNRFEAIRDSMLRHLRVVYEGANVVMQRIEHRLVGLPEFLGERVRLNDSRLYVELLDGPPPTSELPRFGQPPGVGVRAESQR